MAVHCYTSFTFSYLAKARVLAATLKRHHPDWILWAVITDRAPEGFDFDPAEEEFDRVVWAHEMFAESWLFGHDVVEACTAVKGKALQLLLDQPDCEKAFYFDPDIAVFGPLDPLAEALDPGPDGASILLTPHQVDPEGPRSAVIDNEVASLAYGTYNLGFIAVLNDAEGRRCADWWAERLRDWCHDRLDIGVFVDQKWCNQIPAFFDRVRIIRDPGYNVASWNLGRRRIDITPEGDILINGAHRLRFFHFTKLGPIGDAMTQRYARDNVEVYEIWAWYRMKVEAFTDPRIPKGWWHYAAFENGMPIAKPMRVLYRERRDLQAAFPDPRATGENSYLNWMRAETALLGGLAEEPAQ
ncbi:MAG TPA: hypothetical protein VLA52_02615 [Thermohalobaculum sp.]|nr:hypothetical protein [Thermohalobaculum sp.]